MTYKILLADDEPETRPILKKAIAEQDIDLISAESGRMALETTGTEDFDLLIIGIPESGVGNLESLRIIHMSEPDLPILVIGRGLSEEQKAEIISSGANLFVEKPLDIPECSAAVRRLLGIKE
ncbi:response regulator [Planctomycetota bacterium]